jgi:hypothetical protein
MHISDALTDIIAILEDVSEEKFGHRDKWLVLCCLYAIHEKASEELWAVRAEVVGLRD